MGCKVFGRREGVPYFVNAAAGIEDQVFCMKDATATSPRGVKVATAGAGVVDGVIGVVQTGRWHAYTGASASKYPQNADINVVTNGQVRVKVAVTDSQDPAYLVDGDLVVIASGGKAAKYAAPTITPTMTATLAGTAVGTTISGATATIGDTDVGPIIAGATATLTADHPTAAEIKAWAEEIIEETLAAEAVKMAAYLTEILPAYGAVRSTAIKAYIAEYVGDSIAIGAGGGGYGYVGRCVGAPDSTGVVCVELIGLGGIQQG